MYKSYKLIYSRASCAISFAPEFRIQVVISYGRHANTVLGHCTILTVTTHIMITHYDCVIIGGIPTGVLDTVYVCNTLL